MIIWLASYPRSGNTLLRTIIKQTMNVGSYSDEIVQPNVGFTDRIKENIGELLFDGSWDSFYYQASNSKDIVLVKTHLPPRDNQPVIYVVRDGRAATESYAAYHKSFTQDLHLCPSLLGLAVGDDFYGDWTSHFQMWNERTDGKILLLRFEELIGAESYLIEKIKHFIHFDGKTALFDNPMKKLHLENPNFFRGGLANWKKSSQWSEQLASLFIVLHGDLLLKLGYIEAEELEMALEKTDSMTAQLVNLARRGYSERNRWHREASLKENVIQQLLSERA